MDYDDEYATCSRTYVTLRILGAPAPTVTGMLGITPSGAQAPSLAPRRPAGWFLSTKGMLASRDVRRHLDWVLDQLEPKAAMLAQLKSEPVSVDIFCYWLSKNGHGGPTISPSQSRRLAALDLTCSFDVYFPGDRQAVDGAGA